MLRFRTWKLLSLIILLSVGIYSSPTYADPYLLPKVETGSEPTIDGDLNTTSTEWQDSLLFNTTIDGIDAQLRITSDDTNLYIGFNYTSTGFVPVNATANNSTSNLNLQTHDWLAFQFDNNLDGQSLATEESPDDAIIFNQFNNTVYDGLVNNNQSHIFWIDEEYNGTQDGSFAFTNKTNDLTYEFAKPHVGNDSKGADISLSRNIFQLKVLAFNNQTSNSTTSHTTPWFTFRVNATGTGLAVNDISETVINFNVIGESDDYSAADTVFNQFGLNFTKGEGNLTINEDGMNIFILTDDAAVTDYQLELLTQYLELGGTAMIFLAPGSDSSMDIAKLFGLDYLSNAVLNEDAESMLELTADNLNAENRFVSQDSNLVTDADVSNLKFSSSAFNMTNLFNTTATPYVMRQEYMSSKIFDVEDFYYDVDDNETIGDNDVVIDDNYALGVTFDFLKGGRVTLFASSAILSDEYLTEADNMDFILRMLPWNARIVDTIEVHSVEIDNHAINETESINISINATDEFGNTIPGLKIKVQLLLASKVKLTLNLTSDSSIFTGQLTPAVTGSMKIKVIAYTEGYGFAEGPIQELFVNNQIDSYNDLSKLSIWIAILFIGSLVLMVYTVLRTKK
ncbi:MAG: hypothetical protein INQ03_01825 [Candidatus Heimdallarchaeota archaeon]|nr:hypothetical protein [Candidatus Heimdallarchaeota archaeon]